MLLHLSLVLLRYRVVNFIFSTVVVPHIVNIVRIRMRSPIHALRCVIFTYVLVASTRIFD